jgi:hypothetical protein
VAVEAGTVLGKRTGPGRPLAGRSRGAQTFP